MSELTTNCYAEQLSESVRRHGVFKKRTFSLIQILTILSGCMCIACSDMEQEEESEPMYEYYREAMASGLGAWVLADGDIEDFVPSKRGYGQELVGFSGEHAQLVRLLLWVASDDPSTRRNLLLSWFVEQDLSEIRKYSEIDLLGCVSSLSTKALDARRKEIRELIDVYADATEREKWTNYRIRGNTGKTIGRNTETGISELDYVVRTGKTKRFLGNSFLYMSTNQRRLFYDSIPFPPDKIREGWDEWMFSFYFYMLLWRFEPDGSIRRDIIIPRLEAAAKTFGVYWIPRETFETALTYGRIISPAPATHYWDEFSPKEKKERMNEIYMLRSRWLSEMKGRAADSAREKSLLAKYQNSTETLQYIRK